MDDVGFEAVAWWTDGEPIPADGFRQRFLDLKRFADKRAILEDAAMRHGKDAMVDKPGCVDAAQLARLRAAETGLIWSVDFSERFEVPAITKARHQGRRTRRCGAVGKVVQTLGLGPHRHTAHLRPAWFYDRAATGGILCTIELRKYVDVGGRAGGDRLFLSNQKRCEWHDARDAGTPYFGRLAADIRDRTQSAMPQAHALRVTELAIQARSRPFFDPSSPTEASVP